MMIENTSKRDPFVHVLGSLSEGPSGYIEDMEAAGQQEIVASKVLPADAPWVELEALGFTQSGPVPGDEMFVNCSLPEGWKREGGDHAMWSYIVDERGVRRVAVFYKAAFYDRKAAAHIEHPGRSLATAVIYGDAPVGLPAQWGLLTDAERADFRQELDDYLSKAEEHPDIYRDRVERVRQLAVLAQ